MRRLLTIFDNSLLRGVPVEVVARRRLGAEVEAERTVLLVAKIRLSKDRPTVPGSFEDMSPP